MPRYTNTSQTHWNHWMRAHWMRPCHRILRCKLLLSFVDFVLGASERDYLFLENRFFLFGVLQSRIVLVSVLLLWVCIPGSRRCLCWFGVFAIQGRAGLCILLVFFNPGSRWSLYCLCVCMCLQSRVTLVCVNMCLQLRVVLVCVLLLRVCNPRSFAIQGCMAFLRSAMQGRAGLYCFCVFVRQGWAGLGIVVALCWTEVL